jgi:hypothetical protein
MYLAPYYKPEFSFVENNNNRKAGEKGVDVATDPSLTLLNMPLVMNSPNRHPGNNNTL